MGNGSIALEGIRALGGRELRTHRGGGRLSEKKMILAKCYECTAGYADGKMDCGVESCPLHPLMPYRGKKATPE